MAAKGSGSSRVTEKGAITRSTLSKKKKKKMASTNLSRKSERLLKRTLPSLAAARRKSVKQKKPTPLTLRRSERTKNLSSSLVPKPHPEKHKIVEQLLTFEDKKRVSEDVEHGVGTSSQVKINTKMDDARMYRTTSKKPNRASDCHAESNKMDRSTPEGGNSGGGKIDECFKGIPLDCKEVSKDVILPSEDDKTNEMRAESRLSGPVKELLENNVTLGLSLSSNATTHETSRATERVQSDCCGEETLQMLVSRNSNENLIRNPVRHGKGEKLISSKRKGTMVDIHSDVSATLADDDNCNLIADTGPSRLCGNTMGTSESCSKRIRQISLSDMQRDQRKLINNVDQPSSKSEDEKLSTTNKEGKSGDTVERPQANNDESEKIRKQQRSLHLLLRPEIAKLCETLCLPDSVKGMVDSCLEYIMNNRQICTEPASILQAFQLSLCWTAAALLKHKLNRKDSLMLAKRHLNFDCKIEEVNKICGMMRKLKEDFLYHTGNNNVSGPPKASESPPRVHSNTGMAPKLQLANKDISKSTEKAKLLLMQQEEEKKKLTADIAKEKANFERRYKIEWAAIQSCSPNDVMRTEKHKVFNSECDKRIGDLKRLHEAHLKDLGAKQLEARRKFQESWPPHALLNLAALKKLGNGVRYLQTCDGAREQRSDGATNMAEQCSGDEQDEVPSSRQGKLDGTMLSKPVCGSLVKIKANGLKNMASLNSQSPEEHIQSVNTTCLPNCVNAAQIHEADDSNGSNNADTLNSKSPQEHVHSVNAMCMPNSENSAWVYKADDGNCSNTSNDAVTLNSPMTNEGVADGAIVSVLDREADVGMPGTVSFTHCPENVTGMNPSSFMEQISGGAVNISVSDRELSRPCGTASPSNGPNANVITLLNQPSLEKHHLDGVSSSTPAGQIPGEVPETSHEGATVSVFDREASVGMPSTVNCTDYPVNVTPVNSSSTNQISEGSSVLNGVLSSRPSEASSPSNGLAIVSLLNPPSLQQQIPDRVSLSVLDEQIPVIAPETSYKVAEYQLTDTVVVDKSTTSDKQEGACRIMTENTLYQEAAVSRPVDLIEPPEQVQPLSSVESPPDQDTAREMRNSLVSNPVDIVPANQSNHVSLVMEPPEQVQQLPSAEFLSSNQDLSNLPLATGIEPQPTSEDAPSSAIPEASIELPNQVVEQPASTWELDSRPQQSSNLDLDSPMPCGVRTQSSDSRNLSTPSEINNHSIQTATHYASRIVPPLCDDPLKNELEIIRNLTEQNMKSHEDMKLQLKSDFEKELEELLRKYEIKFEEIEDRFQQSRKSLDTRRNTVLLNKILAEAFRSKFVDLKVSGESGMKQDAGSAQQLSQLSRQQNATWPSLVAGPSSCGPLAASLQGSYTTTSSQNMMPPNQAAAYTTSGIFLSFPAPLPNVNSISSSSGNLQAAGDMRAPAPHLQPYRPSTSVLAPSLCTVPLGISSQPTPSNTPVTPPSFPHRLPPLTPTTYQSDPHMGHWPVSVGLLPTPNLSAMDLRMDVNLQNVLSRMSLNISRLGTSSCMPANPAHQATSPDVVCLSDDD